MGSSTVSSSATSANVSSVATWTRYDVAPVTAYQLNVLSGGSRTAPLIGSSTGTDGTGLGAPGEASASG